MSDTMDVRPDERLNLDQLVPWLHHHVPTLTGAVTVRQFGGGAANLTYLLTNGEDEWVLRRPPLGPVAPSSHDMAREFRVLSVLHSAFPAAPKAVAFCDDPAVIGSPFFVMERRHGVVVRRSLPAVFDATTAPPLLSQALVDTLVDLHTVDFAHLGLTDLGHPEGFIARQIDGWYGRWQRAKLEVSPRMDDVYCWLLEHQPASTAVSLVHNDYKLDNTMFDSSDPSRLIAVFDWDMCTLGDPLADLGTLLAYWSQPDDSPLFRQMAMMPTSAAFWSRQRLVERYAQRSGRDVTAIGFYHTLALFRLVVIIAQIYLRYHRGQTADQRFAAFGPLVPVVIETAYAVAESSRL